MKPEEWWFHWMQVYELCVWYKHDTVRNIYQRQRFENFLISPTSLIYPYFCYGEMRKVGGVREKGNDANTKCYGL